jgi:3-hydroxy-D-aspartate aldolase
MACGAIGMSRATLPEAKALVRHGIRNVLIVNEVAGTAKIERLARLSREADVIVGVDNEKAVSALSSVSARSNIKLSVVVDVDTGMGGCGVTPGEPALALARSAAAQGFRFRVLAGVRRTLRAAAARP